MGIKFGGKGSGNGASGKLPGQYKFKVNAQKELELWKDDEKVAMQSPDGSWFKTAVSTGVGSIHLGGGESGDPAHSMSSIGQNVGFKNEAFNATPSSAVVWFPAWQGLTSDLTTNYDATYLEFGPVQSAFAPNGAVQTAAVPFDFVSTIASNICVAAITVRSHEAYSGKVTNIIRSSKGVDLHVSSLQINVVAGQNFTIDYPSLYFARQGDELRLILEKEDGSPMMVRRGTTNTSHPWRTLRVRSFIDKRVAPLDGWPAGRMVQTNSEGQLATTGLLTASRVLISNSAGLPDASNISTTELDVINGNTVPNNSVVLADDDGFVINDGKVMRQATMIRLWPYIQSKFTGAISTVSQLNLTPRRVMGSDSSGKIANTGVSVDELANFVNQTYVGTVTRPATTPNNYWESPFNGIRTMTLRFFITPTYTGVNVFCDSQSDIRYSVTYSHNTLSPVTTSGRFTSNTTFLTLERTTGRGWIVNGICWAVNDPTKYVNFRFYGVDIDATKQEINCQVW